MKHEEAILKVQINKKIIEYSLTSTQVSDCGKLLPIWSSNGFEICFMSVFLYVQFKNMLLPNYHN